MRPCRAWFSIRDERRRRPHWLAEGRAAIGDRHGGYLGSAASRSDRRAAPGLPPCVRLAGVAPFGRERPAPETLVRCDVASTLQDRGGDPESVAVEGLGAGRVVRVGVRVSVDHLVEVKRIDLARIHPREPIPDAVEEKPELLLVVCADGLPRRAATRTLPSAINAPGLLAHESDPHPPDDRLARHLQAGGEASTSKHACSSRQCRGAHRSCGRADPTATRPCGGGHRGHVRAQRGFGRVPPGRSEVAPRRARSDGCRRWA